MLLTRLRQETAPQHGALEAMLRPPESADAYRKRLRLFYGYISPWEPRVFDALRDHPALVEGGSKARWLEEDLRALGASADDLAGLPRCEELPGLAEPWAAMGSLYVWEGATLGGQIASRDARERFGIEAHSGGRFYFGYGADTGRHWRRFCDVLTAAVPPEHADETVAAARKTFSSLHRWVEACTRHGALA